MQAWDNPASNLEVSNLATVKKIKIVCAAMDFHFSDVAMTYHECRQVVTDMWVEVCTLGLVQPGIITWPRGIAARLEDIAQVMRPRLYFLPGNTAMEHQSVAKFRNCKVIARLHALGLTSHYRKVQRR